MKKRSLIHVLFVGLVAVFAAGCYDRGIVDVKDFDHSLPQVENLDYSKQGNTVILTWNIPGTISPAFERPLDVSIQKVENDIYRDVITVGGEVTSVEITTDPGISYRFVVKLAGNLSDEARETGKPDRVYSGGRVIEIQ